MRLTAAGELGLPMGAPPAGQPKKAVPAWLRAEMRKRGISVNNAGGALLFTASIAVTARFYDPLLFSILGAGMTSLEGLREGPGSAWVLHASTRELVWGLVQ